jgi:hypothetical protein
MGQKCCATKWSEKIIKNEEDINKLHFIKKYPIGKGGYGRVNNNYLISIIF